MTGQAADIFISYKAEDRVRVGSLVNALQAEGFVVWWDAQISGGQNWQANIEEQLATAKIVLVVWTKHSVGQAGNFVRDEARRAQRRGVYLPVCLEDVEPPLGFGEIQAVPLKGWRGNRGDGRFRSLVDSLHEKLGNRSDQQVPGTRRASFSRRSVVITGVTAGVAAAGAGGWMFMRPTSDHNQRIAVLPFANLSGDPNQAYFADGIAEELRAGLARVGMQVIGRASSDAVKDLDTKSAAAKLKVANILSGSVRRSASLIRINAQLISGADGVERWAQSYDRAPGDAIQIQTDIASNVVRSLSVALTSASRIALALGGTADTLAQDFMLQSRSSIRETLTRESLLKSVALADAAINRDGNYAEAFVAKAQALIILAQYFATQSEKLTYVREAELAAKQAAKIAPALGSTYVALGLIENSKLNFRDMLAYFDRAVGLSPTDASVLAEAGRNLSFLGRGNQGISLVNQSANLDPLNGQVFAAQAMTFYFQRRYLEAIKAAEQALAVAPRLTSVRAFAGFSLLRLKRPAEALAQFRSMPADDPFRMTGEALEAAQGGKAQQAARIMDTMREKFGVAASYQYAEIEAALGHPDTVFSRLQDAVSAQDPGLATLKVDPVFDGVRSEPRFAQLLRNLRFPT